MTKEVLILNADDFGASEEINYGIARAHNEGLVRSASLMVNMPAAQQAAQIAQSLPDLEVGLHLNISEGVCTTSSRQVFLLVDEEGRFRFNSLDIEGSIEQLRLAIAQYPAFLDQVGKEFASQIQAFYDFGLELGHINIHHYLSLISPQLFEVYANAAKATCVPFRGLCYPILNVLDTTAFDIEQIKNIIQDCGIPCPSLSISNLLEASSESASNDEYRTMMENMITSLTTHGDISTLEIITHPAATSPNSYLKDSYIRVRQMETHLVISDKFRNFVERSGYQIAQYAHLARS
jgi:predicted glycoside hydrolase/deacetylase ChbG (UPF0249 family)